MSSGQGCGGAGQGAVGLERGGCVGEGVDGTGMKEDMMRVRSVKKKGEGLGNEEGEGEGDVG